jgi:hypothetical protein
MEQTSSFADPAMQQPSGSTAQTTIFPFGSAWKYLDTGVDQGTAWRAPAFDDSAWKTGHGKFGYGYRNEATIIDFGPDPKNKYMTTYFRKAIALDHPLAFSSFRAQVKRDDGVVVYVNGTEVYRNNLPTGTPVYTTRASSAADHGQAAIPFTIPVSDFVSGNNVIAVEIHQTGRDSFDMGFDLDLVGIGGPPPGDQTAPALLHLNRHLPAAEITDANTVTLRATFSEAVTGVDLSDFELATTAGGILAAVAAVGTDGTTYDITVTGISGNGTLGINLKSRDTGIMDAANTPLSGGCTGQTYTIDQVAAETTYGFKAVTNLSPINSRVYATKGKEQAKVFSYAGRHWAIISSTGGTYLWRLDGTSWTNKLRVSTRNARADCIVDGNLVHIFLFLGPRSELMSLEYQAATETYQPWQGRTEKVDLALEEGVETGTIAQDGAGRMWLATDAVTDIVVRYSDAPYTSWSAPITLGSGVDPDDVCAIIAMPGKIGVLWGNQNTKRFCFRTHPDGQAPDTWSADEVPASQSALEQGKGMADDHLNIKVASDGTLYCAVKTGYDEAGYPEISLAVRRPDGSWDNLYGVSENGTAPIVVLNEAIGKIRVIYTSATYGGTILYKESATANISFGAELTLIPGLNNYVTSTHQNFTSEIVILASNAEETNGVIAHDVPPASQQLRNGVFA